MRQVTKRHESSGSGVWPPHILRHGIHQAKTDKGQVTCPEFPPLYPSLHRTSAAATPSPGALCTWLCLAVSFLTVFFALALSAQQLITGTGLAGGSMDEG